MSAVIPFSSLFAFWCFLIVSDERALFLEGKTKKAIERLSNQMT